jgi:5-methylcytosine-specific restriction protein B
MGFMAMFSEQSLDEALKALDRAALNVKVAAADEARRQILERFPRETWPAMTLEQFALGHERSHDSYCWWTEFNTPNLGSMKGGSAQKLIIFKHKKKPGWFYDSEHYKSVEEAWQAVRDGFIKAFTHAEAGEWDAIDEIEPLSWGPALRTKTLHIYFPDKVLPVYSLRHLQHFLSLLGRPEAKESGYRTVHLNRALLDALRAIPALSNMSTAALGFFLYAWSDPREACRVVKIAPGENAVFWDDCLRGGFICVGWDDVGDLREYEDKAAFREAFREAYPYDGNNRQAARKGNELWTLIELERGDLVFANQGTSKILAVGEVQEPGYFWNPEREDMKHCVHVRWDTAYAQDIGHVAFWQFVTVGKVPHEVQKTILGTAAGDGGSGGSSDVVADPFFIEIAEALERKGQAILYGPPGTGKTYTARRFADWWLRKKNAALASGGESAGTAPHFTLLTFHASYSYEDFIEGFRPVPLEGGVAGLALRMEEGVFKRICRTAAEREGETFLLLIDEINRANIAKVFGELLTVLEKDKRDVPVHLPQSKTELRVPNNVFLLGTMNTADRSIALLDIALRRRFAFLELMPDHELLRGAKVGSLDLGDLLEVLNRRIARKHGREKQIGHSYLLATDGQPVADPAEFARRFRYEIVPLLQEYCYDDYEELREYLGSELVAGDSPALDSEKLTDPVLLIQALASAIRREAEEE